MVARTASLVDHLVADAAALVVVIAIVGLSGPVATLIANADERSIGNTVSSLGVFFGFLAYRRIWHLRLQRWASKTG
jgi:hypothetical protein